jgi:hypothetical protein
MHLRLPAGKTGDISEVMFPLLNSFRFTVEHLASQEKIREIIVSAKIMPRIEDQEMK